MYGEHEMTHATEGLLQAYLDDEIGGSAAADLRDHLVACEACAGEMEALRRADRQLSEALALLGGADAPMLRAQAAIASQRRVQRSTGRWSLARLGAGGLAKAAMLLLALAGAGAAAIPGSPVRRALEGAMERVAQLFNGGTPEQAVAPTSPAEDAPATMESRMGVMPANGRVRVMLHTPTGAVDVTVRLVDERIAEVETSTTSEEGVRFRTGSGRIEVMGLTAGSVTVDIPRTTQGATLEVDGLVYVYKQGNTLQLSGPAGRDRGEQVRFRIGT
jgi:hypothetical protein